MSANTTDPEPVAPVIPSGLNAIAIIQPSLNSIMIGHTFLTLLIPLFIALFYFSNSHTRRRPIFILNVTVIVLAFAAGVMIDLLAIHSILSPQDPWPSSVNIAVGVLGTFQSILVDLILLVRLIAVHPLNHVGPMRFVLLTSLPILLKVARIVNMVMFIKVLADAARGPQGSENIAIAWATTPYLKIEWSAQVVDNAYASIAFLWTIRKRGLNRQGVTSDINPNKGGLSIYFVLAFTDNAILLAVTFAHRMRSLSRIALSNFIIPSLFSIAQLIVVYRSVDVIVVNEIVLVNTMIAVFGVVFASVWAGKEARREAQAWDKTKDKGDVHRRETKSGGGFALGTWRIATNPPALTVGTTDITESYRRDQLSSLSRTGKPGVLDEGNEIALRPLDTKVDETKQRSSSLV
ncbi:hypothetical protein BS17DRAFT_313955 [Gyrodon lividus]|nr:hypothetical protein BS17DRAFT_313955 [Gyrodon lividus]